MAPGAHASFLDSDFFCRVKGCVIVHDGVSFDVYDAHIFTTNGTVRPGGRLIPWTGNPFQGTGDVNPVFTGSITEGVHVIPARNQGANVGFYDSPGSDGTLVQGASGDTTGFLDAEDNFSAIRLTNNTALRGSETSIRRSFYLSSRTIGFRISTVVSLRGSADALNQSDVLSNVAFNYGITTAGADGGLRFGQAANTNGFRKLGNFNTLSPLANRTQFIAEFPNPIRSRFDNNLAQQSIRFDYIYGFDGYDLSLGAGNLQYQLEFDFFRSP